MMNRRHFLKLLGFTAAAPVLTALEPLALTGAAVSGMAIPSPTLGRVLDVTAVYPVPQATAPVTAHLWQDAVVSIVPSPAREWVCTADGWARRDAFQPVLPRSPAASDAAQPPCWVEVVSPLALAREWCAPDAPVRTRVGQGGVAFAVDTLAIGGTLWYGLVDDSERPLGWSPAADWQPAIHAADADRGAQSLVADTQAGLLYGIQDDREMFRVPFTWPGTLSTGSRGVSVRAPAASVVEGDTRGLLSYALCFEDVWLGGAYWHNAFGSSRAQQGLHLPPYAAKVLYRWLGDGARLIVV